MSRLALPLVACALIVIAATIAFTIAAPAAATTDGEDDPSVSLYRAPDTIGEDLQSAEAVEAAIADGTVENRERMVIGETLVVAIDSKRLASDLAARNGTTTERFHAVLDDNGELLIKLANPRTHEVPKRFVLSEENTRAYRANETTYVLIDTGAVKLAEVTDGSTVDDEIRDGAEFEVRFGYDAEWSTSVEPVMGFHDAKADFSALYEYSPLPTEIVNRSVTVNIAPDDRVVARLELPGETLTERVQPDDGPTGYADVSFDLRSVENGTPYTLTLHHDGQLVTRHDGEVRDPHATLREPEVGMRNGEPVLNVTATLSHGGSVQVKNDTGQHYGQARVEPSTTTNLSIELAERPGNETDLVVFAERERGAPADVYPGRTAIVGVGDVEPTPMTTVRPPNTLTPTATATEQPTTETPPSTASPSLLAETQPTVGLFGTILAALAGCLLARRC